MSKKNTYKKYTEYQPFYVLPYVLLLLIYPFIVQYTMVTNPLAGNPYYLADASQSDIFLYGKMHLLYWIIGAMIIVFICNLVINARSHGLQISDYKKFIPLIVCAVFITISAVVAENKQLAFEGMPGQFENVWVLLGYLLFTVFSYWYFREVEKKNVIKNVFIGSALLIGLVCLLQLLGKDPFIFLFSKENARVAVEGVYGTFFNPNYLGSYVVLAMPVLIAIMIIQREKRGTLIPVIIAIALLGIGLIGSKTSGGYIASFAVVLFAVFFGGCKKLRISAKKLMITLEIVMLVGLAGITVFLVHAGKTERYLYEPLTAIYTNDENIEIHRNGYKFYISTYYTDTEFYLICTDENGNEIEPIVSEDAYTFEDEKYELFSIKPYVFAELNNIIGFELTYGYTSWYFTNDTDDGTYYHITNSGQLAKETAETASEGYLFNRVPKFMSGRGYIWSRCIPMLKETLLIGYGPDSFASAFPNEDYVAAFRGGFVNTFITKPHNMYLQMAIQTGLPSLLAFLVFYLSYFVKSIKLYLQASFKEKETCVGFGIFLGTIGYMVIGIVNDSNLTVAPFFWCMLGIGWAMNQSIEKIEK